MIRTILHDPLSGETRTGHEELIKAWRENPNLLLWADFKDENPEHEKQLLAEHFQLDPLVIADAQRLRHRPKLEFFEKYFFLLLQGLGTETDEIDFKAIQLAFFLGDRFLISRHQTRSRSIDETWQAVEQGRIEFRNGLSHILYQLLRRVSDRYTTLVEGLEESFESLDEEMFENPRDDLLEQLLSYGRNLKRLRRIFNYHQGLFAHLSRRDQPFIDERGHHEFNDVYEQTERLASLTSLYNELTEDLMNGYISITSHRLNQIMKVLTVVTVVFLPLSLLAGIYGMNFENMPELKFEYAYYIMLAVMASIVAVLLYLFRKMRWI